MKKHTAIMIGLWTLFGSVALAQEPASVAFENTSTWRTRYVWRGLALDRKAGYESSSTVTLGSAYLNIWSTARRPATLVFGGSDEIDFEVGWTRACGSLLLTPFVNAFTYPKASESPDTTEIGLRAEYDLGQGLGIYFDNYLDVDEADGALFSELGLSLERELGPQWTFEASAGVGAGNRRFNRFNLDVAKSALNVAMAEAAVSYQFGHGLSIRPFAAVHRILDRSLRNAVDHPDNVVWGLTFTIVR